MFNFDVNGTKFSVQDAAENFDDWTINKSEVVQFAKEEVIVKSFEESFPNISLLGNSSFDKYTFLSGLVSRNSKLKEWFSLEKLKYSELAQLPSYLKDLVEPKKFLDLQRKVNDVNRVISDYTNKRSAAAEEYHLKLNKLDAEMNSKVSAIKGEDKLIKILTLTSQSLPLSMAAALEKYTMVGISEDFIDRKKFYVRELLTNFKISLIKLVNSDPNVDIDAIIDEVSLK